MDLTVARAVFVTGLVKTVADAPDIRRDDASVFARTILRTINICTSANVKACKSFAIRYILPSAARTAILTKYLTAVARNCAPDDANGPRTRTAAELEGLDTTEDNSSAIVSPIARRQHILYIVHDIVSYSKLSATKGHGERPVSIAAVDSMIELLSMLAQLAVCSDGKATDESKMALSKLELMLRDWKKYDFVSTQVATELQESLQEAHKSTWEELLTRLADDEAQAAWTEQRAKEEANKWLIPMSHHLPHDPDAEWHELPATNGLFQRLTHGYPLRSKAFPRGGYSLPGAGTYADEATKKEVEDLLVEVRQCFEDYTNPEEVEGIDELGNIIWKPELNRKRRNHWGYSYDWIEKRRREELEEVVRR